MINISASNFRKGLAIVIACLIWFALVSQFYLILLNRTKPVAETIITFLSYFTILSNLLVAISTTIILTRQHQQDNFFKRETTLTAIAVYITIVGIVYNLILRHIWNPTGLQSIVDHYCTQSRPLLYVLLWFIGVTKTKLLWTHAFVFSVFPTVYCIYILVRGELSGQYPYPFIDVSILGYSQTTLNCLALMLVFLLVSFIFIAIGKFQAARLRQA